MINLTYSLSETDLLNLQLYFASVDEEAKKQRKKEKFRTLGLSALCGIMLLFDGHYRIYSYFFFGATLLFFIVYPWWSAWFYKRMYKKQISSFFKGKLPYHMTITLGNEHIEIESQKGHSSTNINDLKSIIETEGYFFIMSGQTSSVIIPKSTDEETERIREQLENYAVNSAIPFIRDLNWKWK